MDALCAMAGAGESPELERVVNVDISGFHIFSLISTPVDGSACLSRARLLTSRLNHIKPNLAECAERRFGHGMET